jgi:hypothetical protein
LASIQSSGKEPLHHHRGIDQGAGVAEIPRFPEGITDQRGDRYPDRANLLAQRANSFYHDPSARQFVGGNWGIQLRCDSIQFLLERQIIDIPGAIGFLFAPFDPGSFDSFA